MHEVRETVHGIMTKEQKEIAYRGLIQWIKLYLKEKGVTKYVFTQYDKFYLLAFLAWEYKEDGWFTPLLLLGVEIEFDELTKNIKVEVIK